MMSFCYSCKRWFIGVFLNISPNLRGVVCRRGHGSRFQRLSRLPRYIRPLPQRHPEPGDGRTVRDPHAPDGPGQDFNKGVGFIDAAIKKTIRSEKIEIWGDGNNVRDYIYIDDVCRMLISLFYYQEDYDTFNISSNTGTSQRDVIRMLEAMQLAPQVEYLPARSVDAKKIILNNERIMSIHAVPLVPVEQGIRKYYQWLKKEI